MLYRVGAIARPAQHVIELSKPRPLVIWHGLGDSYASSGILQFQSLIDKIHPGIFIHSVFIDPDQKEDQRAGFYGNVDDQVELVAQQLKDVRELSRGFDAIGFSQGGQFLRAYVERYNDPPIHNLITFGSQHMGVSDIPPCKPYDLLCQLAKKAARAGVYSEWAQQNLVQAQYYRDPAQLPKYLESNHFLTSINNEVQPALRNRTYAERLANLDNLILVLFAQDRTVVPKESSWFGSYAPPEDSKKKKKNGEGIGGGGPDHADEETTMPMRKQPLYIEDWIGLRTLDERGSVVLASCEGEHMHLSTECWQPFVKKYVGSRS
ncbi:palmitoyl-protein thioesterase [Multifurca ochricompacta]|uniref:Palmitoyl-protein thioesterase 1 n=1 Tax=Multifurca ochricompacta TaxID=376703 RepID=A0AAD4QNL9_9AGAM|nr:palmitoyl-protein thioesterase [Multifurca ochricompacta]